MKIDVITLFPEMVDYPLSLSIVQRAREKGLLNIAFINPREFARDAHKSVDDKPYGGGNGMVLMAEPIYKGIKKVERKDSYIILLTPHGRVFNQSIAIELSKKKHLIFICAHYEGYDERISDYVDDEISVGDFTLSGGEPACVCIIDSVARIVDGVIKKESVDEESFSNYLLEFPHYTRPRVWRNKKVPDILLSGNHIRIKEWRHKMSVEITKNRRPDLYLKYLENIKEGK